MILNFNITQIETKAYMSPEEIHKYHNINITNEINIKDPSIIESSQISGEIPILMQKLAINSIIESDKSGNERRLK